MKQRVSIGIIGDYDQNKPSHKATSEAIKHAANHLSLEANTVWLPTPSLLIEEGQKKLEQFDGLWAAPGSPYQSMEGALRGIKIAREMNRPFIGT
jgi:CTP synthase (UTP-ammonia lyase)